MKIEDLIAALRRLKVQTGSLACLGCGLEHDCGVHDPRVDTLFLIAQALEVSADELLGLGARIGGLT